MKKELLKDTIVFLVGTLFFCILYFNTSGCDSASANPFQQLYYQQVATTDSLRAYFTGKVNEISTISNRKIDSLRQVEAQLRVDLLACQGTVCDTGAVLRAYGTELEQYLFIPLNNRINQVIDSLNRR